MRTPVADFIDSYIAGDGVRAHMPGHKGAGPLGIEVRDITERLPGQMYCRSL